MTVHFPMGSGSRLTGRSFRFRSGTLTRIVTDGPAGATLLLEALADLSVAESAALTGLRWPRLAEEAGNEPLAEGMAPCFLASQDRFFRFDRRSLAGLFGLEALMADYLSQTGDSGRCPVCRKLLVAPDIPGLAELIASTAPSDGMVAVSAPLARANLKLRRKMSRLGFHRYWIKDRLVDGEDIDESGLWEEVDGVLIDMVPVGRRAATRIAEALMLVRETGAEQVRIGIGGECKTLSLGDPLCPACLESRHPPAAESDRLPGPGSDQLLRWMEEAGKLDRHSGDLDLRCLFSLLQEFSLSELPLSTVLSELSWETQGALFMIQAIACGAPNRFVMIDGPFQGLDRGRISLLRRMIGETRRKGWGWIIAGDEGILADMAGAVILLESLAEESPDGAGDVGDPDPGAVLFPDWSASIVCDRFPQQRIGSGQWLTLRSGGKFEPERPRFNWKFIPDGEEKGFLPVLKMTSPRLAWRLTHSRRMTFAGYLGWDRLIADRMALLPGSRARGWTAGKILGRDKTEMCMTCRGLGVSLEKPLRHSARACRDCGGVGRRFDASAPRYRGMTMYDIMKLTVGEAERKLLSPSRLRFALHAARKLGLGGIVLCRRVWTLSESERWLLVLLAQLAALHGRPGVWMVEEPYFGLSAGQRDRLRELFRLYTGSGGALVTVEK